MAERRYLATIHRHQYVVLAHPRGCVCREGVNARRQIQCQCASSLLFHVATGEQRFVIVSREDGWLGGGWMGGWAYGDLYGERCELQPTTSF